MSLRGKNIRKCKSLKRVKKKSFTISDTTHVHHETMSRGSKYSKTPFYYSPSYNVIENLETLLELGDSEEIKKKLKICIADLKEIDIVQNPDYYDYKNIPWKKRRDLIYGSDNNTNVVENAIQTTDTPQL